MKAWWMMVDDEVCRELKLAAAQERAVFY